MVTIIIITFIIAFFSLFVAFVIDDRYKGENFLTMFFVLLAVGFVLFLYNTEFNIQAEDYVNNPSAYQLDTIGTHINVSKIHHK